MTSRPDSLLPIMPEEPTAIVLSAMCNELPDHQDTAGARVIMLAVYKTLRCALLQPAAPSNAVPKTDRRKAKRRFSLSDERPKGAPRRRMGMADRRKGERRDDVGDRRTAPSTVAPQPGESPFTPSSQEDPAPGAASAA